MPGITRTTLGWSDCGHNQWRTGIVLDPFAGTGRIHEPIGRVAGVDTIGLDYVSCSPFRVPIARLAAAQAALK